MFIHINNRIINTNTIESIDCSKLLADGFIRIQFNNGNTDHCYGPEAVDVIMRVCPAYLEGKRMKYAKNAWTIHNLIGHPAMQLLSWLRLTSLAIKVHDATVPFPKAYNG